MAQFLVISSSIKNIVCFHSYYEFTHPIGTLLQPCFSLHSIFPLTDDMYIVFNFLQLIRLTLAQLLFIRLSFHPLIGFYNLLSISIVLTLEFSQWESQQSTIVSYTLLLHSTSYSASLNHTQIHSLTHAHYTISLANSHSIAASTLVNRFKCTLLIQHRK